MKSFYLYCLTNNKNHQFDFDNHKVEFGNNVYALPFRDIQVILSDIFLDKNQQEKLTNQLQTDLEWTRKNIQSHHQIVTLVNESGPTIPLKFGAIIKNKKSLEQFLSENYARFLEIFENISGKEEWGIKIFWDKKNINSIVKNNTRLNQIDKEFKKAPLGKKWYLEKKKEELLETEINKEITKEIDLSLSLLREKCQEISINENYSQYRGKQMIFNGACLIDDKNKIDWLLSVKNTALEKDGQGFYWEISGPWPPYNFV